MQLPGYKIERLIAEGGMASVYLAVQESLDRYVALKLLKRFDNPTQTLRFFNEGRIIASLNHRNIITIHDIGAVDERHFPFGHWSRNAAILRLRELWDNLSKPARYGAAASTFALLVVLAAGSLYAIQSDAPRQPPVAEATASVPRNAEPVVPGEPPVLPSRDSAPPPPVTEQPLVKVQPPVNEQPAFAHPEISETLALADAALKDYRLTTPPQDNAYHYYRRVLDLDPLHPDARNGITAVGNAYADLADSAFDRYAYRKAKTYVKRGLAVQPDNQRLLALERRTRTLRTVRRPVDTDEPFDFGQRFFGKIKSVFE